MIHSASLLERIQNYLYALAADVRQSTKRSHQKAPEYAQALLCGILNQIYVYHLVNVDSTSPNMSAVDLADTNKSVAVQITLDLTMHKLQQIIERFRSGDPGERLCDRFGTFIVLTLDYHRRIQARRAPATDGFNLQIMNLDDLLEDISLLSGDRQEWIAARMEEEMGITGTDGSSERTPVHLLPRVPKPDTWFMESSRDQELQTLHTKLSQNHVFFLTGDAGMGKTQLACKYAEKYAPSGGAYLLPFIQPRDPSDDIMRETILWANFQAYVFDGSDNEQHDNQYNRKLQILRSEYRDCLIVIDDFNFTKLSRSKLLEDPTFKDLRSIGAKLLFISRRFPESDLLLSLLDEKYNFSLMTALGAGNVYPNSDLSSMRYLGQFSARFVVQLAGLMNQHAALLPLDEVSGIINSNGHESVIRARIIQLLRPHVSKRSALQRQILCCAALLPEDGMEFGLFRHGLADLKEQRAMHDLIQDGWLIRRDDLLCIHPMIREACLETLHPTPAECGGFLDRLWYYRQSLFWNKLRPARRKSTIEHLAHVFEAAARYIPAGKAVFAQRCAEFWRLNSRTTSAIFWHEQVLNTFNSHKKQDAWDLAWACHLTGSCHSSLGEHSKALSYWTKTLELGNHFSIFSDADLANAYANVKQAQMALGDYEAARDSLLKELPLREQMHVGPRDFPVASTLNDAYRDLGRVLSKLGYAEKSAFLRYMSMQDDRSRKQFLASLIRNLKDDVRRPVHRLPPVPAPSLSFIAGSRDRELAELEKLLGQGAPIFIWGMAGAGKTELAIQLAERYEPPKGAYFIRYNGRSLRETIRLANFTGYRFLGTGMEDPEREYQECMSILRTEYPGTMLIIDNFDHPHHTLPEMMAEPTYRELTACGIQLVFTTRNQAPRGLEVRPLDRSDLLALMRQHLQDGSIPDEELLPLIDAVDGHVMAVELMAKTLGEGWGDITPEDILRALRDHRLAQADYPEVESAHNWSWDQKQVFDHMRSLFDLAETDKFEQAVLRCATLLPEGGIRGALFLHSVPPAYSQAVLRLGRRGMLQRNQHMISMHPILREVCIADLVPTDENCRDFLDSLIAHTSTVSDFDSTAITQVAQCLCNASDRLEDRMGTWADHAGQYLQILGQYPQARKYYLRAMAKREQNPPSDAPELAAVCRHVGGIHHILGDYRSALDCHQKAIAIYQEVCSSYDLRLAEAYDSIGTTYFALNQFDTALDFQEKALQIRKNFLSEDSLDLAESYTSLAITCNSMEKIQHALDYGEKATHILQKVLPPEHPTLAAAYRNTGNTYRALGKYAIALEYVLKALSIVEKSLPLKHPEMAAFYSSAGLVYGDMGEYETAQEYLLRALSIREEVLPANHPLTAESAEQLAGILESIARHPDALVYYSKALEIRTNAPTEDPLAIGRVCRSIGTSYMTFTEYNQGLSYLQKALELFEANLSDMDPELAELHHDLGEAFIRLADSTAALPHFQKALDIYEKILPDGHPTRRSAEIRLYQAQTHLPEPLRS